MWTLLLWTLVSARLVHQSGADPDPIDERYLLVLDLDDAIYHFDRDVLDGEVHDSEYIRPHLTTFLHELHQYYRIVIYSSGCSTHVPLAAEFIKDQTGFEFDAVFHPDSIAAESYETMKYTSVNGNRLETTIKSIRSLLDVIRLHLRWDVALERTVFIDDSHYHFNLDDHTSYIGRKMQSLTNSDDAVDLKKHIHENQHVGIRIPVFDPTKEDDELLHLLKPLELMATCRVDTTKHLNGKQWDVSASLWDDCPAMLE